MNDKISTIKLTRDENINKSIPKVCSWCNKIYSIENWQVEDERKTGVTHGICPKCADKLQLELEDKQQNNEK